MLVANRVGMRHCVSEGFTVEHIPFVEDTPVDRTLLKKHLQIR